MTSVLFVAGYPRTGSTLLGNVLALHPDVVHAGELNRIPVILAKDGRPGCSCRRAFRDCPFWIDIGARIDGRWDDVGAVIEAVAEVTGARWLIDSSKTPADIEAHRAAIGTRASLVAHLVRDPRAAIHSAFRARRRKQDRDGESRSRIDVVRVAKAALRWRSDADHADRLADLTVRYEDFARTPAETIDRLVAAMGLAAHPIVSADATVTLVDHHAVWGNRNRFDRGELHIRSDERWRDEMARTERLVVTALTAPGARRHGY